MMGRRGKYLVFALAIASTMVAIVAIGYFPLKRRLLSDKGFLELTQAPVWAYLQGIEFKHRSVTGMKMPMLLKGVTVSSDHDVLGVYGRSAGTPYVWIVLDENAGVNGIYAMPPDEDFSLSCSYLQESEAKEQVDDEVDKPLKEHCRD